MELGVLYRVLHCFLCKCFRSIGQVGKMEFDEIGQRGFKCSVLTSMLYLLIFRFERAKWFEISAAFNRVYFSPLRPSYCCWFGFILSTDGANLMTNWLYTIHIHDCDSYEIFLIGKNLMDENFISVEFVNQSRSRIENLT